MDKKLNRWVRKAIKWGAITLLALVTVGFVFESISKRNAQLQFPPPGEFAVIDDHQLHYFRMGPNESTSPTIVFESGLDQGGHLPWFQVQSELATSTTTLSYDRAGIMWSGRGNNPKTGSAIADELYELLAAVNAPKPYILVGHSLAGLTLRSFISKYPNDIAGVVFIDVSHPDQKIKIPELDGGTQPPLWLFRTLFSTGIARLLLDREYPATQTGDLINERVNALFPGNWLGLAEETLAFDALLDEARAISSIGDIPLVVVAGIASTRWDGAPDRIPKENLANSMLDLQKDLLTLSTNSQLVLAGASGHYIQLQQPEIVAESIRSLMLRIRNDR